MDNKQTMDENTENLVKKLNKLRDARNDRMGYCDEILKLLNYEKERKPYEFDAFLVKAVDIRFKESQDADIILMAFGLLQGYEQTTVTERRYEYLKESDYLPDDLRRKIKPYDEATKKEKDTLTGNLRKGRENTCIRWLADFLLDQDNSSIGNFIDEIDDYIKETVDGKKIVKLPEPSYLKNKRVVQNEYADGNNVGNELDGNNNFQTTTKQEPENNLEEKINIAQKESNSENPAPENITTENQHDRENEDHTGQKDKTGESPKTAPTPAKIPWRLKLPIILASIVAVPLISVLSILIYQYVVTPPKIKEISVKTEIVVSPGEKEDLELDVRPGSADLSQLDSKIGNKGLVGITNDWWAIGLDGLGEEDRDHTSIVIWGGDAEPALIDVIVEKPRSMGE